MFTDRASGEVRVTDALNVAVDGKLPGRSWSESTGSGAGRDAVGISLRT